MSGVGEAAAILSVVSSSFKLLGGCIQAFQFVDTALHLGKHAGYLRCALLLEENELLSWAKYSGLSEDNLDRRLNHALIDETLGNLFKLLSDLDSLKKRYKLDINFDEPTGGGPAAAASDLTTAGLSFYDQGSLRIERERILKRNKILQKNVGLHKKFWFAVVDKGAFEGLLRQVHMLVDGLRSLLNDAQQAALRDDVLLLRLQNISTATKLNQLESLLRAFEIEPRSGSQEVILTRLKTINVMGEDRSGDEDLQDFVKHVPSMSQSSLQPIFIDNFTKEVPIGTSGLQAMRSYNGIPVYVEWKRYDWAVRMEESKKKALNSISNLALLLSAPKTPKFRTLHCMGLLTEEGLQRCQFVYTWPEGCDPHVKPKSLQEYLSGSYIPSLTDRIRLAQQLAGSVFLFHSANWLHKAFCSSNVLFFPERTDSDRSLHNPFIVGFEYSRPDVDGQPSEKPERDPNFDIYRHPAYLESDTAHFHKVFDIYSLGLVLFEIAKWRPLKTTFIQLAFDTHLKQNKIATKSLTEEEKNDLGRTLWDDYSLGNIQNMRFNLTDAKSKKGQPADVEFRAGSIMNEVIQWCLGNQIEGFIVGDESDQKLQEAFFKNVIQKLGQCIV
jgi:hypothetical protein